MAVVSRLKQNNLMISGGVSERLPPITNGLISHFPFDGRGGTFDKMSGYQSLQHIESSINLLEAMNLNWKDPNSWYHASGSGNVTWDESRGGRLALDSRTRRPISARYGGRTPAGSACRILTKPWSR
jgi:hypothetical protein